MQTFLPYSNYADSAKSLDMRRLGKQRVEGYQLLRTLVGLSKGWASHPALKMWKGSERSLYLYTRVICNEWINRGYKDTVNQKLEEFILPLLPASDHGPIWLGNEDFHRSHRANLVAKNRDFYVPQFGDLPFEPYVWPDNGTINT